MLDEEKWPDAVFEGMKNLFDCIGRDFMVFSRSEIDRVDGNYWLRKKIIDAVIHALCDMICVVAIPRPLYLRLVPGERLVEEGGSPFSL